MACPVSARNRRAPRAPCAATSEEGLESGAHGEFPFEREPWQVEVLQQRYSDERILRDAVALAE